jgi:hypothetical protein
MESPMSTAPLESLAEDLRIRLPHSPPHFDPDRAAIDVFSDPFFYESDEQAERFATAREQYLSNSRTIRALWVDMIGNRYNFEVSIGVKPDRLEEYLAKVDVPTRQMLTKRHLELSYGGEFRTTTVHVGSSLDLLRNDPGSLNSDRVLDLAFLKELRLPDQDEKFLVPKRIYVRDCMRMIFGRFCQDADSEPKKRAEKRATAFVGSPGVGTSILFFLAALYQATSTNVIYYRKTMADGENVSVFVMIPSRASGGTKDVEVWFNRDMDPVRVDSKGGLNACSIDLMSFVIPRRQHYAFIDGPRHDATRDTCSGTYDYLCTSGGFRPLKLQEHEKRVWVLDGWTKAEVVQCLLLESVNEASALELYSLCGGMIRNVLRAAAGAKAEIETEFANRVRDLASSKWTKLAVASTSRPYSEEDLDQIRTIFVIGGNQAEDKMQALQIVDSEFVLKGLCSMSPVSVEALFAAYQLAGKSRGAKDAQGYYFKEVIHQWILLRKPLPVTNACRCTVEANEVLHMLTERKLYWIPDVSNFPTVDAALVYEDTLYAFQFVVGGGYQFDDTTFRRGFVNVVKSNRAFQNADLAVVVCFVTHVQDFNAPSSSFPTRTFCVDMTSVGSMATSIEGMMSEIAGEHSGFRRFRQWLCRKRQRRLHRPRGVWPDRTHSHQVYLHTKE